MNRNFPSAEKFEMSAPSVYSASGSLTDIEGRKQVDMKTTRILAVAVLIVASGLALHVALSQQQGIKRTDLQRHDLSVPGREVIQVRVELAPGVSFPKHTHPAKRSSMSSKAHSSMKSRASRP
jgi:hypothetical protein